MSGTRTSGAAAVVGVQEIWSTFQESDMSVETNVIQVLNEGKSLLSGLPRIDSERNSWHQWVRSHLRRFNDGI